MSVKVGRVVVVAVLDTRVVRGRPTTASFAGVGLHFINDASFEWSCMKSVRSNNVIQNGAITIVRIEPSQIGLATLNKKVRAAATCRRNVCGTPR